jgi:hypothetical protein
LKVTKIHQVVEYIPATYFQRFGEQVSDARRAGDVHPNKKIVAETMKLEGTHLAKVWLDHFFQVLSRKSHAGAVSVHGTVLEISTIHKDVHKVVVQGDQQENTPFDMSRKAKDQTKALDIPFTLMTQGIWCRKP